MKQFLIEFEHDSKFLGYDGIGQLLVTSDTFENACKKVNDFGVKKENTNNGYKWEERFTNARNFINLTID